MIKVGEEIKTSQILQCNESVVFSSKHVSIITKKGSVVIQNHSFSRPSLNCCENFVLLQNGEFGKIEVYSLSGEHKRTIQPGFNGQIKKIEGKFITANRKTRTFWEADESLNFSDTGVYFQYSKVLSGLPIYYSLCEIKAYDGFNEEIKWISDISQFGRNIAHHPKTGEVLWDKPNEIKESPFGDEAKIYVPLTGGQLLALYADSGKKAWLWEHPRKGTFRILDSFIYKQDGLSILEINASNGTINREKKFNDGRLVEGFHASGPLWVYEDVIVVCDVLYGKICMLDRFTFDAIEFFSLDKKLINSENAIVWLHNRLYVLDLDNTLHIFEKPGAKN